MHDTLRFMSSQKFNLPVLFCQEAIGDFSPPKVRSKPRKRKMCAAKKKKKKKKRKEKKNKRSTVQKRDK